MASHFPTGVEDEEDYNGRLQRIMQSCLPQILVEVVEQRPQDPIMFLAERLYQLRREDQNTQQTAGASLSITGSLAPDYRVGSNINNSTNQSHVSILSCDSCGIGNTSDYEGDISVDVSMVTDKKCRLHQNLESVFHLIGDLFDLDDVS